MDQTHRLLLWYPACHVVDFSILAVVDGVENLQAVQDGTWVPRAALIEQRDSLIRCAPRAIRPCANSPGGYSAAWLW
jgi:hypothetical protein